MESGNRVWILKHIRLRACKSSGYAWVHLPTGIAFAVKSKEYGQSLTYKIPYVYHVLPVIYPEDWEYA
jgi:hypothetical protein